MPESGVFCERHWSWLCQAGQGKCQTDPAPVTVSDARPPSDTGTTGWRAYINLRGEIQAIERGPESRNSLPVLVVDPAEARENAKRLTQVLMGHRGGLLNATQHLAVAEVEAWLAALAGQGQP